jgi:hypothetical protein
MFYSRANARLGQKYLLVTNTLAYCAEVKIVQKCFIALNLERKRGKQERVFGKEVLNVRLE